MVRILLVGLGGFVGAVARYLFGGWVQHSSRSVTFPFGTLVVNLLGCLCIGLLSELAEARGWLSVETRVLLIIGLLGGFTTFSSFGNETVNLLREGEALLACANVTAHMLLGLGAVWCGRLLAHLLWR